MAQQRRHPANTFSQQIQTQRIHKLKFELTKMFEICISLLVGTILVVFAAILGVS